MLCWLLSSTYIKHRDEATKALVNLLSEQVEVLIETLRQFENVDDMYIYERLYAVAYGVALRTSSRDGLMKLVRYVYETIFKRNDPPKNILLRDHARNIVEYAKYKGVITAVDMKKVRPPYTSTLPTGLQMMRLITFILIMMHQTSRKEKVRILDISYRRL